MSKIEEQHPEDTPEDLDKRITEHIQLFTEVYISKFHERIKEARELAGYDRNKLAERLRCTPASIGMYETGKRRPDLQTLIAFCFTTSTNPSWLLGFGGERALTDKNLKISMYKSELIDMIDNNNDQNYIESLFKVCFGEISKNIKYRTEAQEKR